MKLGTYVIAYKIGTVTWETSGGGGEGEGRGSHRREAGAWDGLTSVP